MRKKKLAIVTAHRDLTVTKMVTASRDWAVTWAVIELWPRRDWAVTSPSRDWAMIIGPRSRDHRGHRELTVTIYFLMGGSHELGASHNWDSHIPS